MKDESIERVIVNNITIDLLAGKDARKIQEDLSNKSIKFYKSLKDKGVDVDILMSNIDNIEPNLIRWKIMYVKECCDQINILNWVIKNRTKFAKLSDYQLYSLYKFGDKFRKKK